MRTIVLIALVGFAALWIGAFVYSLRAYLADREHESSDAVSADATARATAVVA